VTRDRALRAMDRWVDPLLFFLAATSIPMVIVQTGNATDEDIRLITGVSWVIWGAFAANFAVRVALAPNRRMQLRILAWDLLLIVGQPIYTIGDRKADAGLAFLRLVVVGARSLEKGRLLRRTGRKFRSHPLRVVAFIVPFLWLTSAALIVRTESESGVIGTYGDGLWWSAVTIATVGYGDISPKTSGGRGVAIFTMVIGIGMFSLITAKLAELLFIQRTRGTRHEVIETEHTLVLGWSPKVFTIVEQLVIANASRTRAAIVVLADLDFNDMHDDIASHVPSLARSTTTLVTRRGSPSDPADLAMCRPDRARSIIIIDDTENDASVVRTVLALLHGGAELPRIPIVAEIDDPATAEALRLGLDGRVTVVNPRTFVARTAAQACRSAGIALAYEDLLGFEGSELYLRAVPEAVGRSFGELVNAFPDACVVGHRRADGSCDLNPTMDAIVAADDELILLATDDSAITFGGVGRPVHHEVDLVDERRPEHVVIFGWNPLCPLIIRELDGYVPEGSRITIALDPVLSGGDGIDHAPDDLVNAQIVVRSATSVAYADLVQVIAEEDADHAIVLCYRNGLSIAESDAHALVTTLQVRRALETRGRDTTVVTELLDQRDVALAPPNAAGDFIVSDRLVSLLLTQLAENDHLAAVFDDLLDPAGAELYSRPAGRYCEPGVATTFGAIVVEAGRRGESAIGYRRMSEARDVSRRFGATFNPPSAAPVVLDAADQVIVLADHS
jgi:voltage-gated potassium channel Kch